jgi:hypothetical protein
MSVAYFIVLDLPEPGFDPFVNGKSLAHEAQRINELAETLGLRQLDDYLGGVPEELLDELPELAEAETAWFEPAEGITWAEALIESLSANPSPLRDADGVLADLEDCRQVFRQAADVGARWQFQIDY